MMKSETTFFNWCKNDLDINDCDEWFFWLFLSLFIFEKEIKFLTTTFSAIQDNLILKYYFLICLITFRNLNIIFKIFVLIFFIKNFNILRVNNWFNFICIIKKFHIRRLTITFSIAKKINVFIVIEKYYLKLNNFALNLIERYDDEAKSL